MNAKLMKAMFDLEKVDALMHSAEAYLSIDVPPEDRALEENYGVDIPSEDLEQLSGDCLVVDAIYAAEDVRRRRGTLRTEE